MIPSSTPAQKEKGCRHRRFFRVLWMDRDTDTCHIGDVVCECRIELDPDEGELSPARDRVRIPRSSEKKSVDPGRVADIMDRKPTKFAYLMLDRKTLLVKIGVSFRPRYRERTLRSEQPDIVLLATHHGGLPLERSLHLQFAEQRVRGEWFRLTREDVDAIMNEHGFKKLFGDFSKVQA